MQNTVLVDYGSGNLHSAHKALVRAASDRGLDAQIIVSDEPEKILSADRIVLPGVGAFGACRAMLDSRPGVVEALEKSVLDSKRPFLGICVGMQLLASVGIEHGRFEGLGWIPGTVRHIKVPTDLKIPHMGWNTVSGGEHPILPADGDAYFVHSYCFETDDPDHVCATVDYGETFPAMIARDNIAGVQFHPEKSQAFGLELLAKFLTWEPS